MFLFTAIDFDHETKSRLDTIVKGFQKYTHIGRYTPLENFHLTLVFIGETRPDRVPRITRAIEETISEFSSAAKQSIELTLAKSGYFHREGGDIWWVGVKENPRLRDYYDSLAARLRSAGFTIDSREYRPHVTLARGVVLREEVFVQSHFDEEIGEVSFTAEKISLMRSDRTPAGVRYSEVLGVNIG